MSLFGEFKASAFVVSKRPFTCEERTYVAILEDGALKFMRDGKPVTWHEDDFLFLMEAYAAQMRDNAEPARMATPRAAERQLA